MKIKERLAILLAIAILFSACSGTGTNAGNDIPSDTNKGSGTNIPSTPVDVPVKLMGGAPAHPFFYLLKYSVDKTKLPSTGTDTEFRFLLMHNEQSNNPFTTDTEGQVIRRKAGDGDNISAMMIQAGDAAESIYDASGTKSSGTFNMPNFFNRQTGAAEPADLKYSRSLRLLKPNTDYHLYVSVNNAAPVKLTSIKTAPRPVASGNAYDLAYDVDAATAGSTFTLSIRNAEPFYPSAPLLLWNAFQVLRADLIDANGQLSIFVGASSSSFTLYGGVIEGTDTNFVNLRYVDAALEVSGMTDPAENAWVYWFDTDAAHKGWPTIRFKRDRLVHEELRITSYSKSSNPSNFLSRILH